MKKLGKLSISPEKIMKNEELINLQGGYASGICRCYAHDGSMKDIWPNCDCGAEVTTVCGVGYVHYDCI